MATSQNNATSKNNNPNLKEGGAPSSVKAKAATAAPSGANKVKLIDVLRSDVVRVEVVDTDFVITVKSGRKILIREGALNSATNENFSIEFADQEVVTGTELFSQAQTSVLPSDSNWNELITEPTALPPESVANREPLTQAPLLSSNLTTLLLGAGALALAGSKGGGGSSPPSTQPDQTPNPAAQALLTIQEYAQINTSPYPALPSGTAPTVTTYTTANVTGVSNSNIAAINDALATSAITGADVNTTAKIQALVTAYNSIFTLADGTANNATAPQAINVATLTLIGVDSTALQSGSNSSNKLALLNSLLDAQAASGVDRIQKINQLIDITNAIQELAAGRTPSHTLSVADFATIGVVGVTTTNLSALLSKITANAAAGSDSLPELQSALYSSISVSFTAITDDTGYSSTDFITSDKTLTFSGTTTAADGSTIKVTLTPAASGAAQISFTTTATAGIWQVAYTTELPDGVYTVNTDLLDGTNSVVQSATSVSLTIVTSADSSLSGKTIDITGISPNTGDPTDFVTNNGQLTISGTSTADDGAHVAVKINGHTYTTTVSHGLWSLDNTATTLNVGSYRVEAVLVDSAGNESTSTTKTKDITIVSVVDLALLSKTIGAIAASADLVLVFNSNVTAQSNKFIEIFDESTNSSVERIAVTDTSRVTINGATVTINPTNNLIVGKNYHALLDEGAFASNNDSSSAAITDSNAWSFRPVEPSTSVVFDSTGVDSRDGINANELANLTISGNVTSANFLAVSNLSITKITFTSTDGLNHFDITTGLPTIASNTWTFANSSTWTSQLVSGKQYQVSVELSATVSGVPTQSTAVSSNLLIDKDAPVLSRVTCDKTALKLGETATYTLTFSEDPGSSLTITDFVVTDGVIQSLSGTGTMRTVVFSPTSGLTTVNAAGIQLRQPTGPTDAVFTDAVGNIGSIDVGVTFPSLNIDTQTPTIRSATITGLDSTGQNKSTALIANDQIKVTLNMSENTVVNLTGLSNNDLPIFTIQVGANNRAATYVSGSGTSELVFIYTVTSVDLDSSGGITAAQNPLSLNTSRITDVIGNNASLALPAIVSGTNTISVDGGSSQSAAALAKIQKFADDNTDPTQIVGPVPSAQDYLDAGITDYANNVDAINNALATPQITGASVNSKSSLQSLVSAYGKILALANDADDTPNAANPDFVQYALIGVQNVNTTVASLLGDVIDTKSKSAVDTVAEIQELANAVIAVMDQAKGNAGLTKAQLDALGITGVDTDNLTAVLKAIANTADNGSEVAKLGDLQNVITGAVNTAAAALATLGNFADNNSNPITTPIGSFHYVGTVPTLSTYTDAGITGVTPAHLGGINDALATAKVTKASIITIAKVQTLVNAYNAVTAMADGFANTAASAQPDADQYDFIGVTGFEFDNTQRTNKAGLLGGVIDRKNYTDIDTALEIQTLADAVASVMNVAAGGTGLTLNQLNALGFTNVSNDKLSGIQDAIQNTADDGSDVNTYAKLSDLITAHLDAGQQALKVISDFALANSQSFPTTPVGTVPTPSHYQAAGITGVDSTNIASINDALATSIVTDTSVNTVAKLQALVDAYITILAEADGQVTAGIAQATATQYSLLGLTGMDPTVALNDNKASLVSDVIDRKTFDDVNTIVEIQALIDAASGVMNAAKNVAGLTKAQLETLGITGVTDANLALVLQAIYNTPDDGSSVNTVDKLKTLVDTTVTGITNALAAIQAYATDSTNSAPTVQHYLDLGATGVTVGNLASINSALATVNVTGSSVDSILKVQNLVKAYQAVLVAANGIDDTLNANNIPAAYYALLGITGVDSLVKTSLLGDVIDVSQPSVVDTAPKLQDLADAVSRVIATSAGATTLTKQDLLLLGITGVTDENLDAIKGAIQGTADDGSAVATKTQLQELISRIAGGVTGALQIIQDYADSNAAPDPASPSGVAPTVEIYTTANVTGVTNSNIAAINDALATSLITSAQVSTTAKIQDLVNAYNSIFTLADGTANNATAPQAINVATLTLIGVNGSALQNGINSGSRLALLNSLLDAQTPSGIDRIKKINNLVDITNAIQDQAAGLTPSHTLSVADFATIGVVGVSAANLSALLSKITTNAAVGSDSLPELQNALYSSISLSFTAITNDTGSSSTDFITNDKTLTFSGTTTAADGSTIKVTLTPASGAAQISFTTTATAGIWQVAYATELLDGFYTVDTELLDGTNSPVQSATPITLTIDTDPNKLPSGAIDTNLSGKTIAITGISPDSGTVGDFITSANKLIISGTTTATGNLARISVMIDGVLYRGTTLISGNWSLDLTNAPQGLNTGTHTVQAFLEDAAGNRAASSAVQTVQIDTSTLTLTGKTTGAVASTADLILIFSNNVIAQAGKNIQIIDESTGNPLETIAVTDTSRVTINGATVTINPTNNLVVGKNYHATIDAGAFATATATVFAGLPLPTDWTFRPVDPVTTVVLGGVGVDPSNGINLTELGSLEISGVVSTGSLSSVSNIKLAKLTFASTDGLHSFDITTGLPTITNNTWTYTNSPGWTSLLQSGKSYIVSAQLTADITDANNQITHSSAVSNSLAALVDKVLPNLTITCSTTTLKAGQTATLTFTFSETPTDFTASDIVVTSVSGVPLGTVGLFTVTADPKVYTALFTPALGVTATNTTLVSVAKTTYTDAVGNIGNNNAQSPIVTTIDTQIPTVSSVAIAGADSSNVAKSTQLQVGDKIQVTLTMSEAVIVNTTAGTPSFSIDVGGVTKTATYVSGSGTANLVFRYTIALGDGDLVGGITANADALALNGATLQDTLGNNAALSTLAVTASSNAISVETNAAALASLVAAADANSASIASTPATLYARAGVVGVTGTNINAINSALNSSAVIGTQVATTAQVQNLVDAYNAILALADNAVAIGTSATATQFELIGVTGVNTSTVGATTVPTADKAKLLSDVIDGLPFAAVDTVSEVQDLADAVTAVMKTANGQVSGAGALTKAQLLAMGVTGVTDTNLNSVLAAIAQTPDDGSSVNTLAKLKAVVNQGIATSVFAGIQTISNFAGDNVDSQPLFGAFSYIGTAPTLLDYAAAGVLNVDSNNINPINDALATQTVNRILTDTTAEIQAVVDAYRAILSLADGAANAGTSVTAAQFALIGADIGTATTTTTNRTLLNNVLDGQTNAAVSTVKKINQLASVVNALQNSINNNLSASAALIAADLTGLGLTGVTPANLSAILESIAAQTTGTGIDTLAELQALIDFYNLPAQNLALTTDTGLSSTDGVTFVRNLTPSGTLATGATRQYSLDNGGFTTTIPLVSTEGLHTVRVRQVSSLGYLGQITSLTFNYDATAPAAIDLVSATAGVQATETNYYNSTMAGSFRAIAPNIALLGATSDIGRVQVTIGGTGLDLANDQWAFGGLTQAVNANGSGTATINGVGVSWSYVSASKTLSIMPTTVGNAFTAAQLQAVETGLGFTTVGTATQGDRTFIFTRTDVAGNTSGIATETLKVDLSTSTPANAQSAYYGLNVGSAGKALFASVNTITDTDIVSVSVAVGGPYVDLTDTIRLNSATQVVTNNTNTSGSGLTVNGVSGLDYVYTASNRTLTLKKTSGAVFTAAQVMAIEQGLSVVATPVVTTTSSTVTSNSGSRTYTLSLTDAAANVSASAVSTITMDFVNPGIYKFDQTGFSAFYVTRSANQQQIFNAYADGSLILAGVDPSFVKTVTLVLGGVQNTNDKVWVATTSSGGGYFLIPTNADNTVTTVIRGGASYTITYTAASKTLTFSKADGTEMNASEARFVLFSLAADLVSTEGDRTYSAYNTDSADNVSPTVVATVRLDTSISAIDLSKTQAGIQTNGDLIYYASNLINLPRALTFDVATTTDTDIRRLSVTVGGGLNSDSAGVLTFGGVSQGFNVSGGASNATIAGVAGVTWAYSGVNKTLTFVMTNGAAFTASDIQKIESSYSYTTNGATQGNLVLTITHTDFASNSTNSFQTVTVDTVATSAIKLNNTASFAAQTLYYGSSSVTAGTVLPIASNMQLLTDADINVITLAVTGAVDTVKDYVVFNIGSASPLYVSLGASSASGTNQNISGVLVNWSYNQSNQTFQISMSDGSPFTAANVQKIEQAVGFSTTSNTQGDRVFTFTHFDKAGNASPTATVTVSVDTAVGAPQLNGTNPSLETMYYGGAPNAPKTIAANMLAPGVSDIATILVAFSGIDYALDKLVFDSTTLNLNSSTSANNQTIAGVPNVNWSYVYNSAGKSTLTFTNASGVGFNSASVQAITRALSFQTPSSTTVVGDRSFEFSYKDLASNTSTPATETVRLDFLKSSILLSNTADFSVASTSPATIVKLAGTGATAPTVTEVNLIASVQVRVRGLRNGSNEKLISNNGGTTVTIDATGAGAAGTGGAAAGWNWVYNNNTGAFTFTMPNGALGTAAQATALLDSLKYQNTSGASSTDDVRQFFISVTDAAGNVSSEVTSALALNVNAPKLSTTNPVTVIDGNNDKIKGDQFVVTFSEPVKVFANTTGWTVTNGDLGSAATITPLDQVTYNGVQYATNFLVTPGGTGAGLWVGHSQALTLVNAKTGSDSSVTASYNAAPSYVTLPALTFGGAFTIEAWVYVPTTPGNFSRIIDLGNGAKADNIWLGFNNDGTGVKYAAEVYVGQTSQTLLYSASTVVLSTWTHVAVTVNASKTMTIYINGAYSNSKSNASDAANILRSANAIGKSSWTSAAAGFYDPYINMSIADLLIWSKDRTSAEIQKDMSGGNPPTLLDTSVVASFAFDGNYDGGVSGSTQAYVATPQNATSTTAGSSLSFTTDAGSKITVPSSTPDTNNTTIGANQTFQLKQTITTTSGSRDTNDSLSGSAGNDVIAGQGGNDTLTGGGGSDTFAWVKGDTGADTVTDFKIAEGDMINLAGLFNGITVVATAATLANYLNLTQSGNNAILKIDISGSGNFTTPTKTITFTDGWLNGLNNAVVDLVSKRVINLSTQTSTPLMLDLNGDGVHTVSVDQGVAFDLQGYGRLVKTAWTDGHDGLLALDLNHDGAINSGAELFGEGTLLKTGSTAHNGFEALEQYDLNQDHVIDAKDGIFQDLKVWVDANGDGVSDALELHSLAEVGVQAIHLNAVTGTAVDNGNVLSWLSNWVGTDGQSHALADVNFTTSELTPLENMVKQAAIKVDLTPQPYTTYNVKIGDVLASANKTLVITGDATDHVNLDAGWQNTGNVASLNNHTYAVWQNETAYLMVDQKVQIIL